MSEPRGPVDELVTAQRRSIEHAHRLARGNVSRWEGVVRALRRSNDAQHRAQVESMAVVTSALRGSYVAGRTSLPLREADVASVEDAFEAGLASAEELQEEWGSMSARTADGFYQMAELLVDGTDELVDRTFETALATADSWSANAGWFADPADVGPGES